jgi:hypothetical protein
MRIQRNKLNQTEQAKLRKGWKIERDRWGRRLTKLTVRFIDNITDSWTMLCVFTAAWWVPDLMTPAASFL